MWTINTLFIPPTKFMVSGRNSSQHGCQQCIRARIFWHNHGSSRLDRKDSILACLGITICESRLDKYWIYYHGWFSIEGTVIAFKTSAFSLLPDCPPNTRPSIFSLVMTIS
uniref:Uncharacterized protein isoform X6 n=1 Tax=Nicotiana tabacum TaxID=4097 RepID=A0A1S4DF53_TOBAC|nr:PREDICTED: uncharacterized protein LOC107829056 isoform X6 [Nicotiana tabacum]